jgi:SAM-dependent methyltransferase
MEPVLPLQRALEALRAYPAFVRSWRDYGLLAGKRPPFADTYPCLLDRLPTTPYDPHYFHQAVWAAERIIRTQPNEHVDVGSEVNFVGLLSVSVPVVFVDIRPFAVDLPNLTPIAGDLGRALPFDAGSVHSLSCLHVAEHVGLGRYGDALAADGTARACAELARVLAPGGNLFFSLPVGRPRVSFNAHRIHTARQIFAYFEPLDLVEFSCVGDDYRLELNSDPDAAAELDYGCGLFWFRHTG